MEPTTRLRVFVEANILIRGITFPRYPYEVLRLAAQHKTILVVSPPVLADARHSLAALFPAHLPKLDALLASAAVEIAADPTAEEVSAHHNGCATSRTCRWCWLRDSSRGLSGFGGCRPD